MMKNQLLALLMVAASCFSSTTFAWQGMPTPMLHVEGRFLKNPDGQNVTLRGGWMPPTESWFNGGGKWYSNPSDWTNPNNVVGMLNFMNGAGDYKRIKNVATGLFLDGMYWRPNGSDLAQWANSGSEAQQWTITTGPH